MAEMFQKIPQKTESSPLSPALILPAAALAFHKKKKKKNTSSERQRWFHPKFETSISEGEEEFRVLPIATPWMTSVIRFSYISNH